MSDDEGDEWVTEVRQSVAGSVVIHNCFLLTLLNIEMRLLLLNGVNTLLRPGAQQGADDTINEQTWLRAIQSLDGFSVLMFNPSNAT